MSTSTYTEGLGENGIGDLLAVVRPIEMAGTIWWVNSVTGSDSNDGDARELPLATLAQAITNAAASDIIVLQAGHTETRTSALAVNKAVTIVGIGRSNGKPAAQLLNNASATSLLTVSAAAEFRNIYFPANVQNNNAYKADVTSTGTKWVGCYFEAGGNDEGAQIRVANAVTEIRLDNCTVISTATSLSDRPHYGISLGVGVGSLEMNGLVLSGGEKGFLNYAMLADGGILRVRGLNCSLLLGAEMRLDGSDGWVHVGTATGGGAVYL